MYMYIYICVCVYVYVYICICIVLCYVVYKIVFERVLDGYPERN